MHGLYDTLTHDDKIEYCHKLGARVLDHRYRYYILHDAVLSDADYDYLERVYEDICKELGISSVVGVDFNLELEVNKQAKFRVDNKLNSYSQWESDMIGVWIKLGQPRWKRKEKK